MNIIEQIKSIHWPATSSFMAIRIGVASLIWLVLLSFTGSGAQSANSGSGLLYIFVAMPIALLAFTAMAVVAGLLSRVNVPFAGLVSLACALPVWIADPFVWMIFRMKPEWSPVADLEMFNPAVVFVYK